MKKNLLKSVALIFFVTCIFFLKSNSADAQCKYKVVNFKGDTTSYSTPCDFPLKTITGDDALDVINFNNAFSTWNQSNQEILSITLPTISTTGIKNVFFEISQNSFLLFSEERKVAILANSELYKVLSQ